MMREMPKIPAPTAYLDRDGLTMEERGLRYADMLDEQIRREGAETVLAFIMEPVGGASTGALVAPDSYYPRVREICDRHGVLLIHDEVMSGAGRTGRFLGGDHWGCRPDLVAMSKGFASGYGAARRDDRAGLDGRAGGGERRLPARPHLCRQPARLRHGPCRDGGDRPPRPRRQRRANGGGG